MTYLPALVNRQGYQKEHAVSIDQGRVNTGCIPTFSLDAREPHRPATAAAYDRVLSPSEAWTGVPERSSVDINSNNFDRATPISFVLSDGGTPKKVCPQCAKTFVRTSDLERHAKSHKSNMPEFECPAPGCPRKGVKGYWRKDKMMDHYRCKHGRRG